jgi:NADPH:quinone reductase
MKAVQVTHYVSGPQELQVTTLPTPQPHPTKYLIKIHACGTNFFDLLQIQGKYQHQPPLPWIAGSEFSGIVIATPTSSSNTSGKVEASIDGTVSALSGHRFKVGDRVFGATHGAYATHILVDEAVLFPIPAGWSFPDACGLYVTCPTSYGALVTRANTQPGEWVLVHAGAGGVGLSAVQIAKALGATVIATAGSERKREICKQFGADYVIDYRDKTWPQQIIKLCEEKRTGNGKSGVDVVYDPVGKSVLHPFSGPLSMYRALDADVDRHDRPLNKMYSLERPSFGYRLHRRHHREGSHEPHLTQEHLGSRSALGYVRDQGDGNHPQGVERYL